MASRRILKKQIHNSACALYAQCLFTMPATQEKQGRTIEIVAKIIKLREEYMRRVSHVEPGSVKPFFKILKESYDAEVDQILSEIEEQGKE